MGAGKGPFTGYPNHVFLILGNEFCERFSFYGMKAILVLFLTRALNYSDDSATAIYHGFNVACYFMPVFGAMIADGWLGKYKTIFIISIVYSIGNIVMAVGAIPMLTDSSGVQQYIKAIPFIGLVLIAVGTGGIKPCVSAFGADQFREDQLKQKETFFSMFYMAINLGSLLSMIITPILRSNVQCFNDECYAVAFGVPAVLMLVAVVFFIAGSGLYTRHPPGNNVIGNLFGCIGTALKGKCCCSGEESREHWLDYADSKYPKDFITDVKSVMRVLFMFLPLPIFWALFDQQGSRWTLQAGQMNGDFGGFVLQPDLIQVFNPLLVVLIVPLLESIIFPCLDKFRIPNRPLQRLGLGMLLAGTAFIITAFVQITVDNSLPAKIDSGNARVSVLNTVPCDISFGIDADIGQMKPSQKWSPADFAVANKSLQANFTNCNAAIVSKDSLSEVFEFESGKAYNLIFAPTSTGQIQMYTIEQTETARTGKGQGTIKYMNTLSTNITGKIGDEIVSASEGEPTQSVAVKHARSSVKFTAGDSGDIPNVEVDAKAGAVYTIVIHDNEDLTARKYTIFEVVTANSVNMLLQIPQYFTMSLGECFFSVTGLSFAYSQAPPSMKAVLQAAWLLTNSFGNLIVMIISAVGKLPSQTAEFFLFAGLMYVTVIIFAIMSITYKYVEPAVPTDDEEEEDKKEPQVGYQNYGLNTEDEKPPTYEAVTDDDQHTTTYM